MAGRGSTAYCRCVAPAGRAVLIAIVSAVTAAVGAAPADADSILFRCFPNLCRVAPDGSAWARITHDAAAGGPVYGWLSATADGSRLGVSYGNRSYVLDGSGRPLDGPLPHSGGAVLVTQIRPDGGQVATIETIGEIQPPRQIPYLFLAGADGSGRGTVARATAATAWLGDRLLRDESADAAPFEQQICLLASNTDFPCERLVAGEPGHDLWDPAVSPDGSLVAATRAPVDTFQGEIALYSTATAQLVRVLTSGPADSQPTWSPNGRSLAFTRGREGLWVVHATGRPGSERRILASGIQPVWVPGGPLALSGPKRARAGEPVRIRLVGVARGARASLQRKAGRGWTTLATRKAGARPTTFTVRFAHPGRAVLRARARAPGGRTTVSGTLIVTVVGR
jgi:dipeptidyl aminopeptidase/acylaminoacyl peptidase